jgi:hypothetical protein
MDRRTRRSTEERRAQRRRGGSCRWRRLSALTAAAVAGTAATGMALASQSLAAGTYRVYSCRIPTGPDIGAPAPLETVEGDTETPGAWDRVSSGAVESQNTCGSGGALLAGLPDPGHDTADTVSIEFTAPTGVLIRRGKVWRAGDADGGDGYVFWLSSPANTTPNEVLTSSMVFGGCVFSYGCATGVGDPAEPLAARNEVEIPDEALPGSHVFVNATCARTLCSGETTDEGGYAVAVYIYATEMELEETSAPSVSSVSGELAEASTLSGEAGLQFDAADAGSGVYQAIVEVDGKRRRFQKASTRCACS